ncbi:MAG: hypothetical protein QM613_05160 [Micrococcaceae bacterium]
MPKTTSSPTLLEQVTIARKGKEKAEHEYEQAILEADQANIQHKLIAKHAGLSYETLRVKLGAKKK